MALPPRQVYGGVPYSDAYQPKKTDIIELWQATLAKLTGANAGALIRASLSALEGTTADANVMAWVIGDPIAANDGVYQRTGTTWTKRGPLPYGVIHMNNAGAGTGDAIEVTTAFGVPDAAFSALYVLNVIEANTGPVTVSINGGAPKSVVNSTGSALDAGSLQPGAGVIGLDDGTSIRLFLYGDSAAILAAAEAARDAAAQSAAEAATFEPANFMDQATFNPNAVAGDAFDSGNHSYTPTVPAAVARTVADKLNDVRSIFDVIPDARRTEIGDGSGTTGLQSYFDAALEQGGNWYVPRGRYYFDGAATPVASDDFHLIMDDEALMFGAASMTSPLVLANSLVEYGARQRFTGGTVDVSNIVTGNGGDANSGTCISLNGGAFGSFVSGVRFLAGTDYDNIMADTAVGVVNTLGAVVEKCYMRGFGDLAVYSTGGNSLDRSQEAGPTVVRDCVIEGCINAMTTKRGGAGLFAFGNKIIRSGNGIGCVEVGGDQNLDPGHHVIAIGNWIKDMVGSPFSLRGGIGRHVIIGNVVEDWGYGLDGLPTASLAKPGIDLQGTRRAIVKGNRVGLVDRAKTSAHMGAHLTNHTVGATTYLHGGNLITDNQFENVDDGVREGAAGDAALLNEVYENRHRNVTNRYIEATAGAFFWDTWLLRGVNLGIGTLAASGVSGTLNYAIPNLRVGGHAALSINQFGAVFDPRINECVQTGTGNLAVKVYNGTGGSQDLSGRTYNVLVQS